MDSQNPFMNSFVIEALRFRSKQEVPDDVHKAVHDWESSKSYLTDRDNKCSVYYIPYAENTFFGEVKDAGRNIFLYIVINLKSNQDWINMKLEKVCDEMRISRPTALKGLKELTDIGVVTKKSQSEYWINPRFLFNGNRIQYYKKMDEKYVNIIEAKSN